MEPHLELFLEKNEHLWENLFFSKVKKKIDRKSLSLKYLGVFARGAM